MTCLKPDVRAGFPPLARWGRCSGAVQTRDVRGSPASVHGFGSRFCCVPTSSGPDPPGRGKARPGGSPLLTVLHPRPKGEVLTGMGPQPPMVFGASGAQNGRCSSWLSAQVPERSDSGRRSRPQPPPARARAGRAGEGAPVSAPLPVASQPPSNEASTRRCPRGSRGQRSDTRLADLSCPNLSFLSPFSSLPAHFH